VRQGDRVVEPCKHSVALGNQFEGARPRFTDRRRQRGGHRLQTSDVDALERKVDVTRRKDVIRNADITTGRHVFDEPANDGLVLFGMPGVSGAWCTITSFAWI